MAGNSEGISKQGLEERALPRICMPVFSSFEKCAFRAGTLEGQDILAACDAVDVIPLEPSFLYAYKDALSRLVYHDFTRRLVFRNPGLKPVRLTKEYDLFLLVCPWWQDVWYANAIQGWQDHCRTSVCWIMEQWANRIPDVENWLSILNKFDHVIVGTDGSGKPLGDAIGRAVHELHPGIDAIRFSPYPNPPARTIDVYSIGRRLEGIHKSLLALSGQKKIFYVHDTTQTGGSQVQNHREHRELYANMAKRSRFFMVAPGKVNEPGQTHGQVALAGRYFEGSAAGTVLIGQKADCAGFRQHFDWPDSVIEIQPDGSDVAEVLSKLSDEPERLHEISRRNAVEALRRHDWIYRWREILNIAGLRPTGAMQEREELLAKIANQVKR
jgi:hypothetical protein